MNSYFVGGGVFSQNMTTRKVTIALKSGAVFTLLVENESLSRDELSRLLGCFIDTKYAYANGASLGDLPTVLTDFGWDINVMASVMLQFGYNYAGKKYENQRNVVLRIDDRGPYVIVISDENISKDSLSLLFGKYDINMKYICCNGSYRIENLPNVMQAFGWDAAKIRNVMMQLGYDSTGHRFFNSNNVIYQAEPKATRLSAASIAARKRSTRKRTNDPDEEIEESSRSERELQLRAQFGDRFWNRQGVMPIGEVLDVLESARKRNSKKTTRVDEPTTKNPSPLDQLKKYASLDETTTTKKQTSLNETTTKKHAPLDEPTTTKKHAQLDKSTPKTRATVDAGAQMAEAAFNKIVESPAFKARVDSECEKRVKASIPDAEKRVAQLEKQVERIERTIERRVEAEVKRRIAAIVDAASTYVPPDFVWAKDSQE